MRLYFATEPNRNVYTIELALTGCLMIADDCPLCLVCVLLLLWTVSTSFSRRKAVPGSTGGVHVAVWQHWPFPGSRH